MKYKIGRNKNKISITCMGKGSWYKTPSASIVSQIISIIKPVNHHQKGINKALIAIKTFLSVGNFNKKKELIAPYFRSTVNHLDKNKSA